MDGGDAARPEVRGLLFAQRLGVIFRAEVDLDRREHINHDRALHQLYRPLRIDAVRRRIDLEMRARDIGGRQGGGDGRARTAYRLPSRKKHLTPFDLFIFSTWDDIIPIRSEEHTSELQSLMRISYAVFCLKKKNIKNIRT